MSNILFKSLTAATLAAAILAACTGNSQKESTEEIKPWDRQAMSTYIFIGSSDENVDSLYVSRIDFENYDNVYLMDGFFWDSQEEFDNGIDTILAGGGASFPLKNGGILEYAVDEAHKAGTNALITFAGDVSYGACDSIRRPKLVKAMTDLVEHTDADGIDIDWEGNIYPDNYINHVLLLEGLRESLDSLGNTNGRKYYLSTALAVLPGIYPEDLLERAGKALDWVNIMSYDMGGGCWGRVASHNTPYQRMSELIDEKWSMIPREKLHLGLASYGFQYKGILPGDTIPDGESMKDHGWYVNYTTVTPLIYNNKAWRPVYDEEQKSYYFVNDTDKGFISIETPETLAHKFELAAEKGMGGTFYWEFSKDIVPDKNGSGKWAHTLVPTHKRMKQYHGNN